MEEGDRYSVRVSRDTTQEDPRNGVDPKRGDAPEARESKRAERTSGEVGGYVVADAIKVRKAFKHDLTGRDVLREAGSWMGEEYTLGGCSKKDGVDCSCLTQRAYGTFGIYLPDDPGLQYGYGREVERSKLEAGDLVFFKEYGEDGGFTHVGMAVGNGNMVHASSYTGDVLVSSIDSVSGYAGAKRILRAPEG
jgi:cell wall-associated NlpC family hydrolase